MRSPAILRVYKGHQLKEVKQFDLEQIVIGHQAEVQLDLDDPAVSPIHCMIELREDGYYLCDLGSEFGTLKNGIRILDEKLETNDEISLGQFKIVFFCAHSKPKAAEVQAAQKVETSARSGFGGGEAISPSGVGAAANVGIPASRPSSNTLTKPQIKEKKSESFAKSKQTFAPPTQIGDLKKYLKPHKGGSLEVLVCWKDRILQAHHFRKKGVVQVNGGSADFNLSLPKGILPTGYKILELGPGARVFFPTESQGELVSVDLKMDLVALQRNGRIQPVNNRLGLKLEQNEILYLELPKSEIQLVIRYVPMAPVVPLIPPMMMTSGEFMAILIAAAMVIFIYLGVSTMAPELPPPEEEELTRTAQIIFDNKPPPPEPPPEQKPPEEELKPVPPPPPKEEPKRVQMAEKNQAEKNKGQAEVKTAQKNERAGRASELAPNPNAKNNNKRFGSVKQGGAVKIGQKEGSNAQSQIKDVTKVGLFGAFGGGGIRKQLDQAYSGAGGVMGTAAEATGAVGMAENRKGDDLGSKFKESGTSGKGIAIQGIQGVGTKGRGSGQSAYGSAEGLGDKTTVAIEPGGAEENFVGTIDRDQVRRVVRAHLNQIQACYTRELSRLDRARRAELSGKVVLRWEIVEKGAAKSVRVVSSTLNSKVVEGCMKERLATWQFPEPPRGLVGEVTYPFLLKPAN